MLGTLHNLRSLAMYRVTDLFGNTIGYLKVEYGGGWFFVVMLAILLIPIVIIGWIIIIIQILRHKYLRWPFLLFLVAFSLSAIEWKYWENDISLQDVAQRYCERATIVTRSDGVLIAIGDMQIGILGSYGRMAHREVSGVIINDENGRRLGTFKWKDPIPSPNTEVLEIVGILTREHRGKPSEEIYCK